MWRVGLFVLGSRRRRGPGIDGGCSGVVGVVGVVGLCSDLRSCRQTEGS